MPGGAFRIAEGYVEVTADQSAYDRSMARLISARHQVQVGVRLDDREAVTRLDRLARERLATVRLRVDDSALARLRLNDIRVNINPVIPPAALRRVQGQLDRLTRDRVVRIRADVDTRVGAADLANLTRRRTASIVPDVRDAAARARLDVLSRTRRVSLDVDVRGGLGSLTGSGGGLDALTGKLHGLIAAAVGAAPTLASLGESLIQMGPAAAIAAPAVLSVAAAFAAVKLGTSGISDAFKAAFAPVTQAATGAASATRAVENAQRSLIKAEQNVKDTEVQVAAARIAAARAVGDAQLNLRDTVVQVADANHQAAEQVASAERDLTQAQQDARQAQEDLTQARKDAARELEDLNNRLADAQLNQRQDELNLADAQARLAKDKASGASADQLARDQLAVDQATQALKEQQTETKRLQDDTAAANKAGVEGSDKVTAAKKKVADANQQVIDRIQALRDAQTAADRAATDGAEKIAKAERDLADARAAQTKAAVDGARQIADAQQAVADAQRSLAEAQQSGAIAVNKTADALARLAPNARAFVQQVINQRAAWRELKLDVQNRLFAGMAGLFARLTTSVLPALRTGLTGTAGVLNTMALGAGHAVVQLGKTGALTRLFAGLNAAMRPLVRIPGQFITALVQLGIAAAPAFKRLTTAVGGEADKIAKQLGDAFKSGALTDKINTAVGIAKQFGGIIRDAFATLNNIFKAASAGGGNALGLLSQVFATLRKVTASPEVQKALTSIFTAINAIAKLVAGTLGAVIKAVLPLFASLAPVVTQLANALAPVLAGLAQTLGQALLPIVQQLGPVLGTVGTLFIGLVKAITPLLKPIGALIAAIIKALAPVFAKVVGGLLQLIGALSGPLTQVIKALIPTIGPLVGIITALALAMLPLVPQILQLLPPLTQLSLSLVTLAVNVLTPLMPLITTLAGLLATVLAGALNVLIPVITTVVGWITTFVNAITGAVKWVVDRFQWLYDVLVGHSIIPDLVHAIIGWFNQLWTFLKRIVETLVRDVVNGWNNLWSSVRGIWNRFWQGLSGAISTAASWITGRFTALRRAVSSTWSTLWGGIRNTFTTIINTVRSRISDFSSRTQQVFTTLRDSLRRIWNGVREVFAAPIRFVVASVYNNGIRKLWDTIAGKVGLPQLPTIRLGFNAGGVVPGQGRRDTVPALLTPGERILSLAQVDTLGGHRAIDALVGRSDTQRRGAYGAGGIIGSIAHGIGGVISSGADWVKGIVTGGLRKAAEAAVKAVVQPLINRIPGGSTDVGKLVKGIPTAILHGILTSLGNKDKQAVTTGGGGGQIAYTPSAGVAQWAPQILQALTLLGQSAGWLGTVERRMNQESGGNPTIVNRWDSNWAAGTPSVGLMQVIGPTFRSNAGPFGGTGPFLYGTSVNPLANIYAGLHYALHRYGSLGALNRPGGYDSGGLLQPGATLAVNRTGRPERVLNADHTAKLDALLSNGGGGGITIQAINISGKFDFSSPSARRQAAQALVVAMKEELRNFDRGRR